LSERGEDEENRARLREEARKRGKETERG